MKYRLIFFILFFFLFHYTVNAQRLNVFGAELGKIERNEKELRMPYTGTKCYFGYIGSTWEISDTTAGKSFYYLYFNLQDTTKEIGIRLMSPVSASISPNKGDIVEKGYYEYIKANKDWFDPWIALEKRVLANDTAKNDSLKYEWIMIGSNDDNDELFEQPSGKKTNSLFRIISDTIKPNRKLEAGLYRIIISSMKDEKIKGSFILQIGTAIKLYGVKISREPFIIPIE